MSTFVDMDATMAVQKENTYWAERSGEGPAQQLEALQNTSQMPDYILTVDNYRGKNMQQFLVTGLGTEEYPLKPGNSGAIHPGMDSFEALQFAAQSLAQEKQSAIIYGRIVHDTWRQWIMFSNGMTTRHVSKLAEG